MIYTITLNPALDYVVKVDALRLDDVNRAYENALYYGGKGINVSAVLTRLKIDNRALGFTAGFTGAALEELLARDGIVCDFVRTENGRTRINVKIKADTEIDINADGPAVTEAELVQLTEKLATARDGDFVVLAGAVPPSLPPNTYETMMKELSGRGIRFAVDASGELLLGALPYRPFLVKPNHHELGALFGTAIRTADEALYYAQRLQAMGAQNVLVSLAENGAVLLDENGRAYRAENAAGVLVNSVGCGDSMVAGFLAGYLHQNDYAYALRLGTACGNATAFSKGLATEEKIRELMERSAVIEKICDS